MNELKSYLEWLDRQIGCSNDYASLLDEDECDLTIDEVVEVVMDSLQEMYEDSTENDVEVLKWKERLMNIYASLGVLVNE
jgi:hypothetical protein